MVPFNYTKKSPNTYTIILNYFSSEEQLIFESLFLFLLCWLIALELVPERKTFPKIDDSFHLHILIPRGPLTSITKPWGTFPFLPILFNLTRGRAWRRRQLLPNAGSSYPKKPGGAGGTGHPTAGSQGESPPPSWDSGRHLSAWAWFLMLLSCCISLIRKERNWVVHSSLHRCDPLEVLQSTLRGFVREKYQRFYKSPFSAPYQALKICLSVLPLVWILVHPWLFACFWSRPPGTASPTRGAREKKGARGRNVFLQQRNGEHNNCGVGGNSWAARDRNPGSRMVRWRRGEEQWDEWENAAGGAQLPAADKPLPFPTFNHEPRI